MTSSRWIVAVAALLAGCQSNTGPIRIGLAVGLNDAGTIPMKLAAELAVKEINGKGGINGRPLELIERDDHSSNDSAIAVATELYQSDVVAVIGGAYSGATLSAAPIYNGGRRPLVQLSPSASAVALTQAGPFTFRLCPSDLAYGAALARYAAAQGYRRAAILYVNDEYGRGVRQTFADEYVRRGGSIVEVDPFSVDTPSVGPYLARLAARRQAQVIVLAANQDGGLAVLDQIRRARLNMPIVASDGMVGAERTDPDMMEGIFVSSAYLMGDVRPVNQAFVMAYFNANPDAGPPDQGAAATYDAVNLLARVIAEAGPDRAAVRRALAAVGLKHPAFDGVVGQVAFDTAGDVPQMAVQMGVARGGVLLPAQ
ncbi:MAG TPA: penicillin-binding protein activator [Gemmatimonadales bacterium]|nr:penicillin-binding protein activator [Gemmatimonadales bacterium]